MRTGRSRRASGRRCAVTPDTSVSVSRASQRDTVVTALDCCSTWRNSGRAIAVASGEPHVRAVQRGHERHAREAAQPRADESAREPPVRVHEIRLEVTARPHRAAELRAQEAEERELGAPRVAHLRVPCCPRTRASRSGAVRTGTARPEYRRSDRRPGGDPPDGATTCTSTPWSRSATASLSTKEPAASPGCRGNECVRKSARMATVSALGWAASSSTRRRSSRSSARCTAICSPIRPVAKKTLPTMRHVWMIVHTARCPDARHQQAAERDEAGEARRSRTAQRRACRTAAAASGRTAARTTPTACRARRPECAPMPNFDLPAWRGYSGTGISVTVNPCAAAITIM